MTDPLTHTRVLVLDRPINSHRGADKPINPHRGVDEPINPHRGLLTNL